MFANLIRYGHANSSRRDPPSESVTLTVSMRDSKIVVVLLGVLNVIVWAFFILLPVTVVAQRSNQEMVSEIEASSRAIQLELDQSLRRMQIENETARIIAETQQLQKLIAAEAAADRARELAERIAQEQAEAARKAEEAAEEASKKSREAAEALQDELVQSGVRFRNDFYLGILFFSTLGFTTYVVRRFNNEKFMRANQKFGVAALICSALLMVFAVMISTGWVYRFDLLQNILTILRIELFGDESDLVDIPTRYVLLTFLCSAAYGLTTYLGITSGPWKEPDAKVPDLEAR